MFSEQDNYIHKRLMNKNFCEILPSMPSNNKFPPLNFPSIYQLKLIKKVINSVKMNKNNGTVRIKAKFMV